MLEASNVRLTWDRGTVLLSGSLAAGPTGTVWDERVAAWRAPGWRYAEVAEELRQGGQEVDDRVVAGTQTVDRPAPELRSYQAEALEAWELAGRRGVVVLPTGAGKTRTALAAIARCGAPALILVPTRILLDQWASALGGEVGRYGDGRRDRRAVTVATFASALVHMEELGRHFDLLVVDEAHHFGGNRGDEVLEMCRAKWRLGLTATPVEDVARRARLDLLLGEVAYRCEIVDLAGRFLAPFRVTTLAVPLTARERVAVAAETSLWKPMVRAWFGAVPEASWADFVRACQGSDEGRRALAAWRRTRAMLTLTEGKLAVVGRLLLRHAASRVLVFVPDAVSAWALGRALLVPVITADVASTERTRILAAFVEGTVRVVVSARVLNEGVDVPAADVAVLVGDSRGVREYTQRVGRVLRPQEGKEALVYEVVTVGTGEVDRAERRQVAIGLG